VTDLPLILTVFVACAVEAVEALTIVLAAGLTRQWRSTFQGMAAALVVLAAIVAVLGPTITLLPLTALRLVVGALLAIFGLQWLRKAILRASGYKALHDEVVFIVITFGANQHNLGAAVIGAAAAVVVVAATGFVVRAPLSRVPENALKFAVGIMLTSFGTFWGAEGAGVTWPGNDAALLVLVPAVAMVSLGFAAWLRRGRGAGEVPGSGGPAATATAPMPATESEEVTGR